MREAVAKKRSAAGRRMMVMVGIALLAWAVCAAAGWLMPGVMKRANDFFYDSYYHARTSEEMSGRDIVIVALDQASLDAVNEKLHFGNPWPRELWGAICTYLDKAGAKVIVFDMIFSERSAYQDRTGDDDNFAEAIKGLKTPVIFGSEVKEDGTWANFAPPIKEARFGAVNVGEEKTYREYRAVVNGKPSLAVETLNVVGGGDEGAPEKFLLHFYGPHLLTPEKTTFAYVPAFNVLAAQLDGGTNAKEFGVSPDVFKGKIVIVGGTAAGLLDLKSSPLSEVFPGPEVHATAMENLLHRQYVVPAPPWVLFLVPLICAFGVSGGVVFPRRAWVKLLVAIGAAVVLVAVGVVLFRGQTIRWLPPAEGLLVILAAGPTAFAWSYFAEDRQRRFMLKALSKVVSPAVAEQLAADPQRLALGTVRCDLTVLFTDLANFTDLSEGMDVQALGTMLNRYLGEMSDQVLREDGTLDKYIGDAVMCFWNSPLPQKDHAVRACRAALGMIQREGELHAEFAALGTKRIFTRIGINTTSAAVGFIGSEHLFNYTALGDGVNLASRLEGANKLYGTRILISEKTASEVRESFHLRKVDVLRVKGKRESMAVFEVIGERGSQDGKKSEELAARYEAGFVHYQGQQWDAATAAFLEICAAFGEDGPARAMLGRIERYRRNPPEKGWDGVYDSTEK